MDLIKKKRYTLSDIISTYLDMIRYESILTRKKNRPVLLMGLINIAYELLPAIKKVPFMHIQWSGINLTEDLDDQLFFLYMIYVKKNTLLYLDLIQSIYNYYSPPFVFVDFKITSNIDKNIFTITNKKLETVHKKYNTMGDKISKIWDNGTMVIKYTTQELLTILKGKKPIDIYCDNADGEKILILIHS